MKTLVLILLLALPRDSIAESYKCIIEYYKHDPVPPGKPLKPERIIRKTADFGFFKRICKKSKCAKRLDLVKTKEDRVSLWAHNAKAPIIAIMLMHQKYNDKKKDFTQQAYAGTNYGHPVYMGSRSGKRDITVECKYQSR